VFSAPFDALLICVPPNRIRAGALTDDELRRDEDHFARQRLRGAPLTLAGALGFDMRVQLVHRYAANVDQWLMDGGEPWVEEFGLGYIVKPDQGDVSGYAYACALQYPKRT
jgi:hypothetical protein